MTVSGQWPVGTGFDHALRWSIQCNTEVQRRVVDSYLAAGSYLPSNRTTRRFSIPLPTLPAAIATRYCGGGDILDPLSSHSASGIYTSPSSSRLKLIDIER